MSDTSQTFMKEEMCEFWSTQSHGLARAQSDNS